MSMVTADYYYPDWVWVNYFFVIHGWRIAGTAGDWAQNLRLSSQSGAFYHSAIASPLKSAESDFLSLFLTLAHCN